MSALDNTDNIKRAGKSDLEGTSSLSETFTEAKRAKAKADIIDALEKAGGHIGKACQAAGIHRSTFYDWIDKDPRFKAQSMAVIEHKVDNVEFALYSTAIKGNVVAQIFYLKNKRSTHWRDQNHISASINIDSASEETKKMIAEFGLLGAKKE